MKLTARQRELLAKLPSAPSDGRRCRGGEKVTANALVARGLARCVGLAPGNSLGGFRLSEVCYYVRTDEGTRAL